jgi:hypothetical protein
MRNQSQSSAVHGQIQTSSVGCNLAMGRDKAYHLTLAEHSNQVLLPR